MFVLVWLALGAFALFWTQRWAFPAWVENEAERITLSATLSAASWAMIAISGGSVFWLTESGEEIALDVALIQYLAAGLAMLSFAVLILHRLDEYPPERGGL